MSSDVIKHQFHPCFPSNNGVSHDSEPPVLSLWVQPRLMAEEPKLLQNSKENRNSSGPAMHRAMAKANPEIGLFLLAYQFARQLLGCGWSNVAS